MSPQSSIRELSPSRGFAFPGLAMTAAELPAIPGIVNLENWEIGKGAARGGNYTLEELAESHLAEIASSFNNDDPFRFIGFSMGGMILSILASKFREQLPKHSRFRFISSSANTPKAPAIEEGLLSLWRAVAPGDEASYALAVKPFFSEKFRRENARDFENYVHYRASAGNRQSLKAFRRQTAAMRAFDGEYYLSRLNPEEIEFLWGEEDAVFDTPHRSEMRRLIPKAHVQSFARAGHMLNLERPDVFR